MIVLADQIRESSRKAIRNLKKIGIESFMIHDINVYDTRGKLIY